MAARSIAWCCIRTVTTQPRASRTTSPNACRGRGGSSRAGALRGPLSAIARCPVRRRRQDGKLQVKLADQPRYPVFPESDTKFFYKVVEATITFVSDSTGKVTSLVLNQGGRDQTATKVE
jgi:hypothetical protein